jgi:hypothetical protein
MGGSAGARDEGGGSEVGDGTDLCVSAVRGEREMAVTDAARC